MSRRKRPNTNNSSQADELTEAEVWDIVAFARSLTGGYGNATITPQLLNERMKDVSLNPMAATQATLESALLDPKNSEAELQAFSQDFELQSQPYKRLLAYLGSMLSWDLTYTCLNAKPDDYNKTTYKKDLSIVEDFLMRFNYKESFAAVVRQMLRNEAFFCCPRFDSGMYILQELPSQVDYAKITGRWDYGLLMSFSMLWFVQPGVDISMYPPFFRKKYNEVFGGSAANRYYPSISPELRGSSSWAYWADIPTDVGWVFKMNPEIATRVPFFSPLFNDLVLQALMRNLQKNVNMANAKRVIIGAVPMLKETKASVADMLVIKPDLLGKFLALVKSALNDAITMTTAPLEDIQGIEFKENNELYDSFLRTTLATSGVNSNLIFSSQIKPNAIETQLSLNVDEQLMFALYPQFDAFLNYHINRFTRKYKFKFEFQGSQFFTNRSERFERVMTAAKSGIVLPQQISAAMGIDPFVFRRQLEESKAMGFADSLVPLPTGNSGNDDDADGEAKRGRPQKPMNKIGDEGEQTRSKGSNIERGGAV